MSINLMNPLTINYNGRTYTISSREYLPDSANLSGFDFSIIRRTPENSINGRLNLRGAKLSFLDLSNCNLENVDLSFSNLCDSDLASSRIADSIFFKSDIQGAKFTNLQSTNGANFTGSLPSIDTDFTDTNLSNVYFNDWYNKMYPQRGDSTLLLTDEQQIRDLNEFNRTFPTEEEFNTAIAEGEAILNQPYIPFNSSEYENDVVFQELLRIENDTERAEEDVRQGLNTEQRGMQQADIESKQVRLQDRLNCATAQALLANNEEESEFGICSICQENLNPNEEVVDAHNTDGKPSGHIFHKACLENLCNNYESNCPVCRASLNCNEISNDSRNIKLKGGKRSKKRVTNKKTINKKVKRRQTNKKVTRRVRKATNKKSNKKISQRVRRVTRRIRRYIK